MIFQLAECAWETLRDTGLNPVHSYARMVKLVDTADLKSAAYRKGRAGSTPATGTNDLGNVTEWSIVAVLKTANEQSFVSSNLTVSAIFFLRGSMMNLTIERYFKVRFQALIAEVNQCRVDLTTKIAEQK